MLQPRQWFSGMLHMLQPRQQAVMLRSDVAYATSLWWAVVFKSDVPYTTSSTAGSTVVFIIVAVQSCSGVMPPKLHPQQKQHSRDQE